MPRNVFVNSGSSNYVQRIFVGPHALNADEAGNSGGNDAGPNPHELLLAALGACMSITVRMYAERKRWPLQEVHVDLSYARVQTEESIGGKTGTGIVSGIETEISFRGDLTEEQLQRLFEIANRCPIHRLLDSPVPIHAKLRVAGRP